MELSKRISVKKNMCNIYEACMRHEPCMNHMFAAACVCVVIPVESAGSFCQSHLVSLPVPCVHTFACSVCYVSLYAHNLSVYNINVSVYMYNADMVGSKSYDTFIFIFNNGCMFVDIRTTLQS